MTRLATSLLLGLALLTAAACGGGDRIVIVTPSGTPTPGEEGSASPEATPSPTEEPSPTATTEPDDDDGPAPVEGEGTDVPAGGAILVDVRTGGHEGFDRIVFEFQGGIPGYRIEYVEPPIVQDGSGREVEIAGDAFLRTRLSPAAAHDPMTGELTYEGPQELTPPLGTLVEAEQTVDFEGVVTWVMGLVEEVEFSVLTLEGPFRLVIDVEQP